MATNLLPTFSSDEWENEGVTITSSSDYDITFTASLWTGMVYNIPSDWLGQNIIIGCESISGGGIYIQDSSYNDLFDPITSGGEYTYTMPSTATFFYIVSESDTTVSVTGIYAYMEGDTGGSSTGETVTATLRPTSATGTSWSNTANAYDSSTTTRATVSITSSTYSSRTLTLNFSALDIPEDATLKKATLTVIAAQSSSQGNRRITVYADINGNSSSRVINQQLTSTSATTMTADVLSYITNLSSLKITGYMTASNTQTFSVYEVYVDVTYELPPEEVNLTDLSLNESGLDLKTNASATLNCILTPEDANTYELIWSKDNNNVEITPNDLSCTVKAVNKGTSIITVTDSTTGLSASCMLSITIPENQIQNAYLGSVEFSNMYLGEIPILKMYVGDILVFYNINAGKEVSGFNIGYTPVTNEDTTLASNAVIVTNATELTNALDNLSVGQTVYLRSGDYNIGEYYIGQSGTSDNPIVIRNYPNEKPILKGSSLNINNNLSYITIKGLTMTDINLTGNDVWGKAIFIGTGNSYIIIEDNEFYNLTSEGGTSIESGIQAIYACGDANESDTPMVSNCIIRNNYIHDCATGWSEAMMLEGNVTDCQIYNNTIDNTGNIGIDVAGNYSWTGTVGSAENQARNINIYNNLIKNCQSEYATAAGIYSDGARNITISHNIVYNCQCGIELGAEEPGANVENFYVHNNLTVNCGRTLGVGGYQSTSATHQNTFVYNNTFIGGDWYADDNAMIAIYRTTNFQAYNNIFYAQSGNALIENENGTITFNYNCWYQSGLSSLPSGEGVNSFIGNPQFVNYTNTLEGDYTLQSNSICLNKGSYNAAYCGTFDLKGNQRVNDVIDIGCYENI